MVGGATIAAPAGEARGRAEVCRAREAHASAITLAHGLDAVVGLGAEWRALEGSSRKGAPFAGFELARRAAEAALSEGSLPVVICFFGRTGALATILPLRLVRRYGTLQAIALAQPLAQYTDAVGAPLAPADLSRAKDLLASELGIDLILLRKVREDSAIHEALAAIGSSQNAAAMAPAIDLASYRGFTAYEAGFSGHARRNWRQQRRKLEAAHGPGRFAVETGAEAERLVALAIDWKCRWLGAMGMKSPVLGNPAWRDALVASAGGQHAATSVFYAAGRPVAIELGYTSAREYASYLGAFDPEFAAFGVGTLQMLGTIEWAFGRGFETYDLLAPADAYKLRWTHKASGIAIDDFAIAASPLGQAVVELRRRLRPLARDLVLRLGPDLRAAGARYAMPAGVAATTALGLAAAALGVD